MKCGQFSPGKWLARVTAVMSIVVSGQVFAQYSATESFDGPGLSEGADGWIGQYKNTGPYSSGDIYGGGGTEDGFKRYDAAVTPPNFTPYFKNGNYLNFYARYDDATIRETALLRNMGGFGAGDPFTANNGDYTMTACYFLMPADKGGADFANGVSAGMGVRYSGAGYSSWPSDESPSGMQVKTEIPSGSPTGVWTRLSLNVTLTNAARVDAGFWVANPTLSAPYISTGVLWDDFYFGLAANAPTTACAGGSDLNLGPASNIPTLPWGGLLALIGLMGWLGLRRRA